MAGRLQRFREIGRPLRREHAIADRLRRQHEMRRVAVHAVDGDIQVGLLGFGGNAGRWPAAHHVHDHDRDFRGGGEAERFDHQRKPGPGGCRQRRRAAIGCADDHVDCGEFVFGLQQRPADFGKVRREPFEDFRRRRDRIGGGKANAAADGAERGRLVARQQPPAGGARLWRGELQVEIDARCRAEADLDAGQAGLDGGRALVGETLLDRRKHLLDGKAKQPAGNAERDHVGAPVGDGLGHLLHRNFDDAGAGLGYHRRQVAAAGIADHQSLRSGLDFGAETVRRSASRCRSAGRTGRAGIRPGERPGAAALPLHRRGSGGPWCG